MGDNKRSSRKCVLIKLDVFSIFSSKQSTDSSHDVILFESSCLFSYSHCVTGWFWSSSGSIISEFSSSLVVPGRGAPFEHAVNEIRRAKIPLFATGLDGHIFFVVTCISVPLVRNNLRLKWSEGARDCLKWSEGSQGCPKWSEGSQDCLEWSEGL